MKRPLAYITASWGVDPTENTEIAAKYSRKVFDAGYSPICPILMLSTFIDDGIPQEHKDRQDIELDYLRRSNVLVVWGSRIDEAMKNDIAIAERYRIPATTLSGILTVKTPRSEKPYKITEESIPDFARNIGKKECFVHI